MLKLALRDVCQGRFYVAIGQNAVMQRFEYTTAPFVAAPAVAGGAGRGAGCCCIRHPVDYGWRSMVRQVVGSFGSPLRNLNYIQIISNILAILKGENCS